MRKLQAIKARQIEEAAQAGHDNPYLNATVIPAAAVDKGSLEHYQAAMSADINSLSALKTLEDKAKAKKTMIETYWGFVDNYVKQGHAYPNDIAVRVMIWLLDIADIERGLNLALYLIEQGIHITPAKFDRDLPTFVCDAMYDWANDLLKKEQSVSPYLDILAATIDNDNWSLSPPVQSKVYAMLAKHKNREGDYAAAVKFCDMAEQVNPEGAGVKSLKAAAFAKVKNNAA